MMPEFLMSDVRCRLNHAHNETCNYQVQWALNPLTRIGEASIHSAAIEHENLRKAIVKMGASVRMVSFVEGAYDSVFIKDSGILFERGATRHSVLGSPKYSQRKLELARRTLDLEAIGFHTVTQPDSVFEGGDFVFVPDLGIAFMGYGQRSEQSAAHEISRALEIEVVPLELRDSHMYHLDLSLGVLSNGAAFACKEAFSPTSWQLLNSKLGGRDVIEVPREFALTFDLNWVETPQGIIHSYESRFVPAKLKELGFNTLAVPLSQFEAAGGSAACLVSRVWTEFGALAKTS